MPFNLSEVLRARQGENFSLQARYMNPQMGRVLKTIGFDHYYVRGEGCYLYDAEGRRYLDFLSGFGVFALGRGHPAVTRALHEAIDADLPNLVQMDCAPAARAAGRGAGAAVARRHRAGLLHQLGGRGHRGGHQVRPGRHQARRRSSTATTASTGSPPGPWRSTGAASSATGSARSCSTRVRGLRRHRRPRAASCARGDVAAFVVEPIQGKGVNHGHARSTGTRPRRCAARHRRCSSWTRSRPGWAGRASSSATSTGDSQPDIITVSKALSGGYVPVGAMLSSAKVFDSVYSSMDRAVVHSSTFSTNQLAMVAGLATLQAFDDEDIVDRGPAHGRGLHQGARPAGGAPRVPPRGAGQGPHDRARVRQARVHGPATAVAGHRDHAHRAVLPVGRGRPCITATGSSPRWPPTT